MQEIIVFIIVLLAAVYIVRSSLKKYKGAQSGSCGCSQSATCSDIIQEPAVLEKKEQ